MADSDIIVSLHLVIPFIYKGCTPPSMTTLNILRIINYHETLILGMKIRL
jgi:hypothetical protein